VKDIQKDLIDNDPSKGSQTDRNTQKSDEDENDSLRPLKPKRTIQSRRNSKLGNLTMRSFRKMNSPGKSISMTR
jgi:hypothetical protein